MTWRRFPPETESGQPGSAVGAGVAVTSGEALVVAGVVGTSLREVSGVLSPPGAAGEPVTPGSVAPVGDSVTGVDGAADEAGGGVADGVVVTALDDGVVELLDSPPLSLPPQAAVSRPTATAADSAATVEAQRADRIDFMAYQSFFGALSRNGPETSC